MAVPYDSQWYYQALTVSAPGGRRPSIHESIIKVPVANFSDLRLISVYFRKLQPLQFERSRLAKRRASRNPLLDATIPSRARNIVREIRDYSEPRVSPKITGVTARFCDCWLAVTVDRKVCGTSGGRPIDGADGSPPVRGGGEQRVPGIAWTCTYVTCKGKQTGA